MFFYHSSAETKTRKAGQNNQSRRRTKAEETKRKTTQRPKKMSVCCVFLYFYWTCFFFLLNFIKFKILTLSTCMKWNISEQNNIYTASQQLHKMIHIWISVYYNTNVYLHTLARDSSQFTTILNYIYTVSQETAVTHLSSLEFSS